jgi:MFS family permease
MELTRIARRTIWTLFAAQSLGSAALIAIGTVTAIVAAELTGDSTWAGLPSATLQLAAAFSAFGWGFLMDWVGRRGGLTFGLALGAAGALLASWAVVSRSFTLFLSGLVLIGVARAALQLSRFAAAEVNLPEARGRAIAYVVLGGTVGAIAGPLLVGPSGVWTSGLGYADLLGPFLASFGLLAAAGLVIFGALRPDPREVGREVSRLHPEQSRASGHARSLGTILRQPAVIVAITAMVVSQMVMVMLMVITSLHMRVHDHVLSDISLVVSSHTLGMFAFSIISGRLTDRWGRTPVILTGAGTLVLASLLAPLSPDVLPLAVSLFLLGLGWNFCFVGGSSLLADQLSPDERARTQGFNDLLIGLAAAIGSLSSGLLFAAVGYGAMGLIGLVASLIPIAVTLWWRKSHPPLATPA